MREITWGKALSKVTLIVFAVLMLLLLSSVCVYAKTQYEVVQVTNNGNSAFSDNPKVWNGNVAWVSNLALSSTYRIYYYNGKGIIEVDYCDRPESLLSYNNDTICYELDGQIHYYNTPPVSNIRQVSSPFKIENTIFLTGNPNYYDIFNYDGSEWVQLAMSGESGLIHSPSEHNGYIAWLESPVVYNSNNTYYASHYNELFLAYPIEELEVKVLSKEDQFLKWLTVELIDAATNNTVQSPVSDSEGIYFVTGIDQRNSYFLRVSLKSNFGGGMAFASISNIMSSSSSDGSVLNMKIDKKDVILDIEILSSDLTAGKKDVILSDTSAFTSPTEADLEWFDEAGAVWFNTIRTFEVAKNNFGIVLDNQYPLDIIISNQGTYYTYGYTADNTFYRKIYIDKNLLEGGKAWDFNHNKNREWHEFGHALMNDIYGFTSYNELSKDNEYHWGYANPNTGDSLDEGFAEFWACVTAKEVIPGEPPSRYDDFIDLEYNCKAWEPYQCNYLYHYGPREEFAVAGVLWDIVDGVDSDDKDSIGPNPSNGIIQLFYSRPSNVRELYDLLKANYGDDVDLIFISHGFFKDNNAPFWKYDPTETVGPAANGTPLEDFEVPLWDEGKYIGSKKIGINVRLDRQNRPHEPWLYINLATIDTNNNPAPNSTARVSISFPAPYDFYDYSYDVPLDMYDGKVYLALPPSPDEDNPSAYYPTAVISVIGEDGIESNDRIVLDAEFYGELVKQADEDGFLDATLKVGTGSGGTVGGDTDPPITEVIITPSTPGGTGWYPVGTQVKLATNETAAIRYKWDEGEEAIAISSVTLEPTEGTHKLSYHSTDLAGNAEVVKQLEITIKNAVPIELTIPSDITLEATAVSTPVDLGQASATGGVQPITITSDAPAGYPVGTTTVTWTATDSDNNSITKNQKVTITDTIKPVLTVPTDVSKEATGERTVVDIGQATATDIFPVTITNDAPVDYPLGETIVTWKATDANGNTSTGTQKVNVVDAFLPEVTVPPDVAAEANAVRSVIDIGQATANDPQAVITNDAPADYPLGETIVTWTAKDSGGHTATGTQKVTVIDSTKPVLTVPPDITTAATGDTTVVDIGTATATDIFPVSITNDAPAAFPAGLTVVTWTATDANNNIAAETQKINITSAGDTAPPEALIKYDLASKSIKVYNSETGEEADYTVVPEPNKDDDQEEDINRVREFMIDSLKTRDVEPIIDKLKNSCEIRQYTLKDSSGNTQEMMIRYFQASRLSMAKVISIKYNGQELGKLNQNCFSVLCSAVGKTTILLQKVDIKKQVDANAIFNSITNKTMITIKMEKKKLNKKTIKGKVILETMTDQGNLVFKNPF